MRIRLHYTWILFFGLVTAIVTTQFTEGYPLWQKIVLGLIVSVMFLAAVTLRELVVSTAVFRRQVPVKQITVFAFGGLYNETQNSLVNTHLVLHYLVRYLSHLVIAIIFYGLYATFINAGNVTLSTLFQWLAYIYTLLFLLHFIPAFPLDGGRILRMFLWRSSGDFYRATARASLIGWAVGLLMIFAGVMEFIVTREWMVSLLLVIMGWTLQAAAGQVRRKTRTLMVLKGIRVQDVMTREFPMMSPQINVGQLVRDNILVKGWNYLIVIEGAQLKGFLTLKKVKSVPFKKWKTTTIGDIMTPSDRLETADPLQTADILQEDMDLMSLDYIPVLQDEHITGVVTRKVLQGLMKTRAELGV
jgi:Zn-dependent protease